jgi:hypothetical protein
MSSIFSTVVASRDGCMARSTVGGARQAQVSVKGTLFEAGGLGGHGF